MKRTSFIKGLILGASVLAFAGTACADITLNIYGPTEQYYYWLTMTQHFLFAPTAAGGLGCTFKVVATCDTSGTTLQYGGLAEVASGTECAGLEGANVAIHYTAKSSFDGAQALENSWGKGTNHQGDNFCDTVADGGQGGFGGTGAGPYQRLFCQTDGTLLCDTVHIGVCDVDVSDFQQSSSGLPYGPWSVGGPAITTTPIIRNFTGFAALAYSLNVPYTPIAVPFAFYVNPGVTIRTCAATSPIAISNATLNLPAPFCSDSQQCGSATCTGGANNGQACLDNDECQSGSCSVPAAHANDCPAAVAATGVANALHGNTITNLSRLQAVALFSGTIANWQQFGLMYANLPVTVCLRHAGSGIHATLDLGVMKAAWGASVIGLDAESRADNNLGNYPYVYFNDGPEDMQNCLFFAANYLADQSGKKMSNYDAAAVNGAVGYMYADTPSNNYYFQVSYNGVRPNRVNMRDGLYDDFWSLQRVYTAWLGPGSFVYYGSWQQVVYSAMIAFMENGSNITRFGNAEGVPGMPEMANWYTSGNELNFTKGTSNNKYYPSFTGPYFGNANVPDATGNTLPYAP